MEYNQISGLFWDYENVPLRNNDWEDFMNGLKWMKKKIERQFESSQFISLVETIEDRSDNMRHLPQYIVNLLIIIRATMIFSL